MKVFINHRVVEGPWGGGNAFLKACFDFFPEFGIEPTNTPSDDVKAILLINPVADDLGFGYKEIMAWKNYFPKIKLIHRVNDCDARKNTTGVDALLQACSRASHATVFVSKWMQQYHNVFGWECSNQHVIINGVNKEHFKPGEKLNNGKVNIVAHHWSSNALKGEDVYRWIDDLMEYQGDKFTFTYIGRTEANLKYSKVIPPLYGKSLGEELAKYDVYVTGTKFDPGPNHAIEGIACGLPTYARFRGGGANEFVGPQNTFKNLDELYQILHAKSFQKNIWQPSGWRECIEQYAKVIKS